MNISESVLYQKELSKAVKNVLDIDKLNGKSILITGATGLVCSAVVDLLCCCNIEMNANIRIFIAGRNKNKVEDRFKELNISFIPYDANKEITFNMDFDYIIHGASNATPNTIVEYPVETMHSNYYGLYNLLNYSLNHNVKKLLFISSSEIYGIKHNCNPFVENEYGDIDLLNPRCSYAMSKRASETLCNCYKAEYGVNSVIARPGHIYGPTAQPNDNRVSSLFAYAAAKGEDLVLKSEGLQIRSYCHCFDCATALLSLLTRGISGEAYNISNKNSIISIREMANILASLTGVKVRYELPNAIEKASFNHMDNSSLNSNKLESLGWHAFYDAKGGFSQTVQILNEIN